MRGVMGGGGMRQGRTRGRRAMTGPATLLVLLLMLHHPSMGLMPMTPTAGLSGHGLAAAASSVAMPMGGASGAASSRTMGTQGVSSCSGCAMTCPLMDGITPHRSALRSPTPYRAGHAAWPPTAAAVVTPTLAYAAHNLVVGVTEHIPAQRTRRAILQVYLL
jgi:hypothetical protein